MFSGGQDSTTCLAHALSKYDRVETLGFDYGQRHSVELQARLTVLQQLRTQFPQWAPKLGEDHVLSLDVLKQIGGSSLTEDVAFAMQADGLSVPQLMALGGRVQGLQASAMARKARRSGTSVDGIEHRPATGAMPLLPTSRFCSDARMRLPRISSRSACE